MKRISTLVMAISLTGASASALAQTCELRFNGSIDLPRSCVLAPTDAGDSAPDPFVAEVGFDMSQTLFQWIRDSWAGRAKVKNGELSTVGDRGEVVSTVALRDAHIVEVTVPAMDPNSKGAAYFGVKIQPTSITYRKGDGSTSGAKAAPKSESWIPSNFKLELDGLPTDYVVSIDSFTWSRAVPDPRRRVLAPKPIVFPVVTVTMSMIDWQPWADWPHSGIPGEAKPLAGHIAFLAPDMKSELGRVALAEVTLLSIDIGKSANAEVAARFRAKLVVGSMVLHRP